MTSRAFVEKGKLVGVISDRDAGAAGNLPEAVSTRVKDVMKFNVYSVTPETPLAPVVTQMAEKKYGSTIVKDAAGKPVGIFTAIDALKVLATLLKA